MTLTKTKNTSLYCQILLISFLCAKSRACLQFADRYRYKPKRIILVKNVTQQTNQYVFIALKWVVMVIL